MSEVLLCPYLSDFQHSFTVIKQQRVGTPVAYSLGGVKSDNTYL